MSQLPSSGYAPKPVIGPISGFTNFNEAQHYLYNHWLDTIKHVYQLYGFTAFMPRPVELRDNLHFKGGIGKQIYSIARSDESGALAADGRPQVVGTDIGLPFDRTVPLAIWVTQYVGELTLPFKRYDIGWVFRGETAQAGRFRGFHQADVDIIGRNLGLSADVEVLLAVTHALKALEVGSFVVNVNHIMIAKSAIAAAGVPATAMAEVLRIIDKLEKLPLATIKQEIHKAVPALSEQQLEQLLAICTFKGNITEFEKLVILQHDEAQVFYDSCKQLSAFVALLTKAGCSAEIVINLGIARGLDYYTGIVYETFIKGKESFGSVASGGRYSGLIGGFASGKHDDVEGVGISIGVTRLFDVLFRTGSLLLERKSQATVVMAYRHEVLDQAFALATILRNQGVNVDMYTNPARPIKNQLEYADKKGIPYILMLMSSNENPSHIDAYVLRNLQTRDQHEWQSLADVVTHIKQKLV